MCFKARKVDSEMIAALVAANNVELIDRIATFFHKDQTATQAGMSAGAPVLTRLRVTAANSSDLPTSVALVNNIRSVCNTHFVDAVAHNTAVSAAVATAVATDLATSITLANALKAAYNTHLAAAGVHYTNDATNAVAAANASDQASLTTLLNEMKADVNAHIASAPAGAYIDLKKV